MDKSKEDNADISVALAVYNGERFLQQQLESLENQTLKPRELVVVDDCSSDASIKIIDNFPSTFEKKIYRNEKNEGVIRSFRKATASTTGKYIALCDQDDIWLPNKLQLSLQKIKECDENKASIVFTDLKVIDDEGKVINPSYWKLRSTVPDKFTLADILFGNIITGCTTFFNQRMKEEFLKMPDEVMMHDHWLALIAYSFGNYAFIDQPTILFRSHNTNVTTKTEASFLQNFISSFRNSDLYLDENIKQAIAFRDIYKDQLSREDLRSIDSFIQMKNAGFLRRRLRRDSRSLWRRIK